MSKGFSRRSFHDAMKKFDYKKVDSEEFKDNFTPQFLHNMSNEMR